MKLAALALALVFASCAASPSRTETQSTADAESSSATSSSEMHANRVVLYVGQRRLDKDDYEPVEEQLTVGIEFSQERPGNAFGWEIGIAGSGDEAEIGPIDFSVATGEIYVGARKTFGTSRVRPYIGAGLSVIYAEARVEGGLPEQNETEDDVSAAIYAHGGLTVDLSSSFFLGLDLRGLFGSDLEFSGLSTDADYGQLAFVLGWSF